MEKKVKVIVNTIRYGWAFGKKEVVGKIEKGQLYIPLADGKYHRLELEEVDLWTGLQANLWLTVVFVIFLVITGMNSFSELKQGNYTALAGAVMGLLSGLGSVWYMKTGRVIVLLLAVLVGVITLIIGLVKNTGMAVLTINYFLVVLTGGILSNFPRYKAINIPGMFIEVEDG